MSAVLVDTGVIVAWLDRSEHFHERCVTALGNVKRPLATCEAVITESCYLLRDLPGAAEAVIENVEKGVLVVPFQLSTSAGPVRQILRKYRDRQVDLADACLIHMAAELDSGEILTLDRDFEIYRWGRNKPFHLLISFR